MTRREGWLAPAVTLAFLAVWEGMARAGRIPALFFPAPSTIGGALLDMMASGRLWPHLLATLRRMAGGMVLGGIPGLLLGLGTGWSRRLRALLDPVVAALHPLPKITLLPLIMIILGIGESALMVVVAFAAFFPLLISTAAGVRQIRPIYFEVAENYGARGLRVFSHVVLPGSLPLVMSGLRLALNSAMLVAISVELVAAQEGLGALAWFSWQTLRTRDLYATLVVTAALGVVTNAALQGLSGRLLPWQGQALQER